MKIAKHEFARAVYEAQRDWIRDALDPSFSSEFFKYAKGGPFSGSAGVWQSSVQTVGGP